jgi:hypothetical protein
VNTNELLLALQSTGIELVLGVDGVLRTVNAAGRRVAPPSNLDAALRQHAATLKAALATVDGAIEYSELAAAVAAVTLPPVPPLSEREARTIARPTARQRVAPLDVAAPEVLSTAPIGAVDTPETAPQVAAPDTSIYRAAADAEGREWVATVTNKGPWARHHTQAEAAEWLEKQRRGLWCFRTTTASNDAVEPSAVDAQRTNKRMVA